MRKHIFADETGCMTFKRGQNISRYFILCTIVINDPKTGDQLLNLRREMTWRGVDVSVFHATKDNPEIREEVFNHIKSLDFRIDATILEKSKCQPQVRKDDLTFYQYAWFYHLKHVAPRIVTRNDELHVTAASLGTSKKEKAFRWVLNDVTKQLLSNISYATSFWAANTDPCLQIADYCAWALHKKWEHNKLHYYNLIEEKIYSEYNLFSIGKTHYY